MESRALTTQDAFAWRNLLGEAFPASDGAHYLEDFPVWDLARQVTSRHILACADEAGILGGAAARLVDLHIPTDSQPLRGAVIGAVATAERARGHGIATHNMRALLQWCDARDAEFIALWGSEHRFYSQFGFELAGRQVRGALRPGRQSGTSDIRTGWNPGLEELLLLSRGDAGLVPQDKQLSEWKAHQHVQWSTLWEGDRCVAYAGVGKHMDLHHLVHEWGSSAGDEGRKLGILLGLLASEDSKLQILAHPRQLDLLQPLISEKWDENLALMRLRTARARQLVDQFWFWGLDSA